jgi:hypothetical protein
MSSLNLKISTPFSPGWPHYTSEPQKVTRAFLKHALTGCGSDLSTWTPLLSKQ